MNQVNVPFKVGDTAELKTFEEGYRGAWFRCEITRIFKKGKALHYMLKYLDYPGEDIDELKVYQKPRGEDQYCLMIRPSYPRQCDEKEALNLEGRLEEAVVVHGVWKVGDMVDWWKDDCFWSGTVLEVGEDESVKIELLPEPFGEGGTYECLPKDLRPTLEWSPEKGWSVPSSESEDGERRLCAMIIKPPNEDQVKEAETREEDKERPAKKLRCDGDPVGNVMESNELMLNIMVSECIEAAVMDLEEQYVRIEWLKDMLAENVSTPSVTFTWKYEDHIPSSSTKT